MLRIVQIIAVVVVAIFLRPAAATAQVLDAANETTFAINSSGQLIVWGKALPNTPPSPLIPGNFPPAVAVAITGGSEHGLAIDSSGFLYAWGGSATGGEGVMPYSPTDTFKGIAGGKFTSFALRTDGTVGAWGENSISNNNVVNAVNSSGALTNVTSISAGDNHFVALKSDGTVVALGTNALGQTTSGSLTSVAAVSAGMNHSLALHNNGTVSAWGSDSNGQASGFGAVSNAVAVSGGGTHSLVLRSDGTVLTTGNSAHYGTIGSLTDAVYVSAGTFHSYAVRANGDIVGFGLGGSPSSIVNPVGLSLPTSVRWSSGVDGDYLNSHRWAQGIPSTANSSATFDASGTYAVNFGANAQASALNVTAGNVTFNQNGNSYTVGGPVNVSGAGTQLTVAGSGSQLTSTGTLTNSSTLNVGASATVSAANISNSSLISVATGGQLTTTGTLTNSNTVNIANGGSVSAALIANTGTITNNGTINGDVTTTGAGVLKGSGAVLGTGTTSGGGVLAPGNSVGLVTGTNWTFGQDGAFDFEINDATGVAGGPNGWDALQLTGNLSITATVGNPFLVNVSSLAGASPGQAANFSSANNYSWAFVTAGSITGFAANLFAINTAGFTNPIDGGAFSISQSGNSLFVNFTSAVTAVPEPSSLLLLAAGGAGFAAYRRRRQSRVIVGQPQINSACNA